MTAARALIARAVCALFASLIVFPDHRDALLQPLVLRRHRHRDRRPSWISSRSPQVAVSSNKLGGVDSANNYDDQTLLESIDPSVLRDLCAQYSLSASGTKKEMLQRLRQYASDQAETDRERRRGRAGRVEANLQGKARHTIVEGDLDVALGEDDEEEEDMRGYFYYAVAETEDERKRREDEKREERRKQRERSRTPPQSSSPHVVSPLPLERIVPNEKGERVVTVYSTSDKNDLTGMTAQAPSDMSMENARYRQKSINAEQRPEETLVGGPFGDTSGSRRKKADSSHIEKATDEVRDVVRNLLATTGAPAFRDDYEEGDDDGAGAGPSFASPYGFVGFQPKRIPPNLLSQSSAALRAKGGKVLEEVLSEYELQAIGHDGMAADDVSEGGGHYREVGKVGAFLEGYRKAEERRVARETSTLLLDRLVREGVGGLDSILAGMVREGDGSGTTAGEVGELNGALLRYLEEVIREQERRVRGVVKSTDEADGAKDQQQKEEDCVAGTLWNITMEQDGTIVETIDPNDPRLGQMIQEDLERTNGHKGPREEGPSLATLTVQEKMLLLLKLLRDRVKVEAVVGNDAHARNLRTLAYCLKAANDNERSALILGEVGNSLDSLDTLSDLITASIDYAEARSNDDFIPGDPRKASGSAILNVPKLQKIKNVVERIRTGQLQRKAGVFPNGEM